MRTGVATLGIMVTAAIGLTGCQAPDSEKVEDRLQIVVSIEPQRALLERVVGSDARVHVLVEPGQSPATYELRPRQVATLAESEVWFQIGVPFEATWTDRIAEAAPALRIVDQAAGVERIPFASAHGEIEAHGHGASTLDPHCWTDPARAALLLENACQRLRLLDPPRADAYARRCSALADEIAAIDARVIAALEPCRGATFLVFHPTWGYLAERFGLRQIAVEDQGRDPGPRALSGLIELAREEGVRAIFVQRQYQGGSADALAAELGLSLVRLDPLSSEYPASLASDAERIAEALR